MTDTYTFSDEIENMMYASDFNPIRDCIQCGTCSGTCPAIEFMDNSPREIIGLIRANLKEDVINSNTYWSCASCYHCTVRCPAGIDISELMYTLKRYSIWNNQHQEDLIGPDFSESFVKMIVNYGRSYEPALAFTYLPKYSASNIMEEALNASELLFDGKLNIFPKKIKRIDNFRNMVKRILPLGESK
jgi:heterodisulfide reductase subunit C